MSNRHVRLLITLLCCACAKPHVAAPAANPGGSGPPNLTSVTVLLTPVQRGPVPSSTPAGAPRYDGVDQLDAELTYWLKERAPDVHWVFPADIDRLLERTPALDIKSHALEVAVFRRAQVRRIGDPLFGDLRRLAAVFDARVAVVPVAAEYKPSGANQGHLEVAIALIDLSFGEVKWFGVIAGDAAAPDSPSLTASVAQRVAARFGHAP